LQEIVFGEFDDLIGVDPEEHAKIFSILHGGSRQSPPKVEVMAIHSHKAVTLVLNHND